MAVGGCGAGSRAEHVRAEHIADAHFAAGGDAGEHDTDQAGGRFACQAHVLRCFVKVKQGKGLFLDSLLKL